jgi:hypothetical protein
LMPHHRDEELRGVTSSRTCRCRRRRRPR